jgi:hypothetical protein
MNYPVLKELVKALRSGKYKKGVGALRYIVVGEAEHQWCCEGVMCDLAGVPIVKENTTEDGVYTQYSITPVIEGLFPDVTTSFAPRFVWEGTGMETHGNGQVAGVKIPSYSVDIYHYEDTGEVRLDYNGVDQVSLASLNDYQPIDPKNAFTFEQIADLLSWYYHLDD